MKNFIKICVTFLTIFLIFTISSHAKDQILPLPKPNVSADIKKATAEKKNIYPKKKPKTKKEDSVTENTNDDVQIADTEKEEAFIYPQKKPIIVQKKSVKLFLNLRSYRKKILKLQYQPLKLLTKKNGKLP